MRKLFSFLKTWWGERPTIHRVFLIAALAGGVVLVGWVLYRTAGLWLPPVVCLALVVWAVVDSYKQAAQRQQGEQQTALQQSQREAAEFTQWLFCKQQRDLLGIQAVPLVASLAHLARHIESEQTPVGLVHTLNVGLQSFNQQAFYLLWESLKEPIDEALANYCSLKNLVLPDGSARFTVVSVDILDGAILPQIVLKIADKNFGAFPICNLTSQRGADLWI